MRTIWPTAGFRLSLFRTACGGENPALALLCVVADAHNHILTPFVCFLTFFCRKKKAKSMYFSFREVRLFPLLSVPSNEEQTNSTAINMREATTHKLENNKKMKSNKKGKLFFKLHLQLLLN